MTAETVTIIYVIALLISVGYVVSLIFGGEQHNINHLCIALLIAVGNLGYLIIIISDNLETALLGNRLTYLSGCFLPLALVIVWSQICDSKMSKSLTAIFAAVSTFTLFCAWTQGIFPIYYKTVEFEKRNGIGVLIKEYGPLHNTFSFLLVFYLIAIIVIAMSAFEDRDRFSYGLVWPLLLVWVSVVGLYFGVRTAKLDYDLVPIGYTLSLLYFLRIFREIDLYDMNMGLINTKGRLRNTPFIMFDLRNRLTAYNEKALEIFPELKDIRVDAKPSEYEGTSLYTNVYEPIFEQKHAETPPFDIGDYTVSARVRNVENMRSHQVRGHLVEIRDLTYEKKTREIMENSKERLSQDVQANTDRAESIRKSIVSGMGSMIESRDQSTGGHIERTSAVVHIMAKRLEGVHLEKENITLTKKLLHDIEIAAPMHDIGKIMVDDAVLRKQGKYTTEEFEKMKTHPAEGARLVRKVLAGYGDADLSNVAENVAHYHHEKWDGRGYPDGLKGTEIPIEARIMALADVFDALVSRRCYKDAYSYEQAFKIIKRSDGSHFDPTLVKFFLECRKELEEYYDKQNS
jgi:putative two-component system response regulator